MRIKVKDFNCINEAELIFNPGLTVLQGESNGGKSSIFRAIENTIFNQSGTSNVQHGKQAYLVGIENGDHKVLFKKGKAGSVYKIDGVEYSKMGVGQPEQVADALGIRETTLAGEKIRLNFWGQMRYPFLLDRSPGQLYRFIVDSSESESLSSVLKDIARDIKDANAGIVANDSKLDVLRGQLLDVETKLQGAERVESVCNEIIAKDAEFTGLNQLTSLAGSLHDAKSALEELVVQEQSIKQVDTTKLDDCFQRYQDISVISKYQGLLADIRTSESDLEKTDSSITILTKLDELDYTKISELERLAKALEVSKTGLQQFEGEMQEVCDSINSLDNELSEFKVCPLCGNKMHN